MATINVNGQSFEVDNQVIQDAISDADNPKEITIQNDDFIVRSKEDDSTYVENHKRDARKEGVEIAIKNARNDMGLDFQGKTMENLLKAAQAKAVADANIKPTEMQATIDELRGKLTEKDNEYNSLQGQFDSFKSNVQVEGTLRNTINSSFGDKLNMPLNQVMTLFKAEFEAKTGENGVEFYKNGQLIKDNLASPAKANDVITSFFDNNKHLLKPVQGGAAGGDSNGSGGKKTTADFNKEQADAGNPLNSPKYIEAMRNAMQTDEYDFTK